MFHLGGNYGVWFDLLVLLATCASFVSAVKAIIKNIASVTGMY